MTPEHTAEANEAERSDYESEERQNREATATQSPVMNAGTVELWEAIFDALPDEQIAQARDAANRALRRSATAREMLERLVEGTP